VAGRDPGRPLDRIPSRKDKRRAGAQARAAAAHLRKAVKEAEARIAKLDRKKAALEARLAEPEVYDGPTAALQALQVEHGAIRQALTAAEEAWLDAQSAVEDAAE
jgi:ATP-binding cassette subfamily F protein 3